MTSQDSSAPVGVTTVDPQYENPLPDGSWWAEGVQRVKVVKGVTMYYVKWWGWPKWANTWEPASHLHPDMLLDALELDIEPDKFASKAKKAKTKAK